MLAGQKWVNSGVLREARSTNTIDALMLSSSVIHHPLSSAHSSDMPNDLP